MRNDGQKYYNIILLNNVTRKQIETQKRLQEQFMVCSEQIKLDRIIYLNSHESLKNKVLNLDLLDGV